MTSIKSRPTTKEYQENYDKIFSKEKEECKACNGKGEVCIRNSIDVVYTDCPTCNGKGTI